MSGPAAPAKTAVKGSTPFFFADENVDRLFAMVLALGAEISKVDEKLDTVLRLLEQQKLLSETAVRDFEPDEAQQAARDKVRKAFVETLLAPFQLEADSLVEQAAAKKARR